MKLENLMSLGKLGKINTKLSNLSKFLKLPNHKPNHKRIQVWVGLTASHITKTKNRQI